MPEVPNSARGHLALAYATAELELRGFTTMDGRRREFPYDSLFLRQASGAIAMSFVDDGKKVSGGKSPKFFINKDTLKFANKDYYYLFVAFGDLYERPDFFIVPSLVVAERIQKVPGALGINLMKIGDQTYDMNDNWFYEADPEQYRERWDLYGPPPPK